jgi:hypothetical protein
MPLSLQAKATSIATFRPQSGHLGEGIGWTAIARSPPRLILLTARFCEAWSSPT